MANTKPISYFSVDCVNLHEVAGTESHVFDNDVISIILNGSPYESSFLHEGHIYQLPEPRLLVVTSGEGDVHLNLEEYHVDKGTVILTPLTSSWRLSAAARTQRYVALSSNGSLTLPRRWW